MARRSRARGTSSLAQCGRLLLIACVMATGLVITGCTQQQLPDAYGSDAAPVNVAAAPSPAPAPTSTPTPAATPAPTASPTATPLPGTPPAVPTPLATQAYVTSSPLRILHPSQVPQQLWKLWDGTSENLVYVVHTGWNNQLFDLHLFEELIIKSDVPRERRNFNGRLLNGNLWRWDVRADGWHFELDQHELLDYRLEGRLWVEDTSLRVEGTLTNRMATPWEKGIGLICLRTRSAADFAGTDYLNAWIYPVGAPPITVNALLKGQDYIPGTDNKFFNVWVNHDDAPKHEPRIAKTNKAGTRRIEAHIEPGGSLGGNREPGINCIHANLGIDLPAGQSMPFAYRVDFTGP